MRTCAFASFLTFVCAPLAAQVTWVVDAAKGAGYHFDSIRPALAWASSGDSVLVRSGVYREDLTVSRGTRLFGLGSVQVDSVTVRDVPAGAFATVSGLRLGFTSGYLRVENCAGGVHVADLQASSRFSAFVSGSEAVTLQRCQPMQFQAASSRVVLLDCSMAGGGNLVRGSVEFAPATPALDLRDSIVQLVHSSAVGGAALGNFVGAHAMRVAGPSVVSIAGDAQSSLRAGSGVGSRSVVVAEAAATLRVDPAVQLVPQGAASAFEGGASVVLGALSSLRGRGAAPGGTMSLRLRSKPASIFVLAFSAPARVLGTQLGDYWLDPVQFVLQAGAQGASGETTLQVSVPSVAGLRGAAIPFQALTIDGARLELSNGYVAVLN